MILCLQGVDSIGYSAGELAGADSWCGKHRKLCERSGFTEPLSRLAGGSSRSSGGMDLGG